MNAMNEKLEYHEMEDSELVLELALFERQIQNFFQASAFDAGVEYQVSKMALIDMIIRTDKRKAYYYCFHGMKINECKVAALYAYWILKYRPITLTDARHIYEKSALKINEAFAIYIIYAMLRRVHNIKQTTLDKQSYYEKLMYSFRFRHISIDAMMLLVESIGEDTLMMHYEQVE